MTDEDKEATKAKKLEKHWWKEYRALTFAVNRSVRYHASEMRFFGGCHRWSTVFVLFAGSGAMAAIAKSLGWLTLTMALAVTFLSAIQLVFNLAERARIHGELKRSFQSLEIELVSLRLDDVDEERVKELQAERIKIEFDEPPVKKVLNLMCQNEARVAEGHEAEEHGFKRHHRWFAHFVSFENFESVADKKDEETDQAAA